MSNLTSKPLSRQQIKYAVERCRRIATKKMHDLDDAASEQREPELTDYTRVMMIKEGTVELDLSRVKPDGANIYYHAPRLTDCADFSAAERAISTHNKVVDKKLKAAKERVSRRTAAIIDRFELGEPAEALDLLVKFEAEEFSLCAHPNPLLVVSSTPSSSPATAAPIPPRFACSRSGWRQGRQRRSISVRAGVPCFVLPPRTFLDFRLAILQVADAYGLHYRELDAGGAAPEMWLLRNETALFLFHELSNTPLNSSRWHKLRGDLCGVPWDEVDLKFHERRGYQERCEPGDQK